MKGNLRILSTVPKKTSCLSEVIIFSLGKHKRIGMPMVLCRVINIAEIKRKMFVSNIFPSPVKKCIGGFALMERLDPGHILIKDDKF